MNKTDNTMKESVSTGDLWIIGLINVVIFALWIIGNCSVSAGFKGMCKDLPDLLRNLATVTTCLLALVAVKNGLFSKGGDKYYPHLYGEKKLKKSLINMKIIKIIKAL